MKPNPKTRFADLLRLLTEARVEFVVVGGVAAFLRALKEMEDRGQDQSQA